MYSAKPLPLAISHRGLHDTVPENSIPAFLAAIEAGAEGIELDVHASADDILFVHHDDALETSDGETLPFAKLEASAIGGLRLDGEVAVPTLDDALAAIGSKCAVFIEVKATGVEHALSRCLKRHLSNSERYAVHAFDHRVVKRVLELNPSVRTGALQVSYLVDSCGALRRAGASDLWQHADFIDSALVADVHSCGGRIIAWTPNSQAQWASLAALGVDGICTDHIDAYVDWKRSAE